MSRANSEMYQSIAAYYTDANGKYNKPSQVEKSCISDKIIPPIEQMNTTKELYDQYPKLRYIEQLKNIDSDCLIEHKLYTHTSDFKNSLISSFGNNMEDMEGWFKLIVNHCCYLLYLVKNQYCPSISYDFLRQFYMKYLETMGPLMRLHFEKHYEQIMKNHRQYLLNNDRNFQVWFKKKYPNFSYSLNNLEIEDIHEFAFWSKDLCDANDILTYFLPNKVRSLYQQHVDELIERITPKTKKQWNDFFVEFDDIYDKVVWHLEFKEADPLYLSHIKENDDIKNQEIIQEIIVQEKFLILFGYAYEILLCGSRKTLDSIVIYFEGLLEKSKLVKRNVFFSHLKDTINKKIIAPNTFSASLSTAKILDIYITLFSKLNEMMIESFTDVFRETLYPILDILQKRSDIFMLLSYCFYNEEKMLSDQVNNLIDNSDLELLDKFRLFIANDKSLNNLHGNSILKNGDVAFWFKNNYLHKKVYSSETLRIHPKNKTFADYVNSLGEIKYNSNLYTKQESVILQVINSLACSNKEKFLMSFLNIYHNYLLRLCDRDTDDWRYPFNLLLKTLFKEGVDDSAEHAESAIKTMILDMAVSTHDFGQFFYNEGSLSLAILANEYWNIPMSTKYNEFLLGLLVSENNISSLNVLLQNYKALHYGQQLFLNGEKSTMVVNLRFDDGRIIRERCSIFEGTLINFISQQQTSEIYIGDIKKTKEFCGFSELEIEDGLRKWEILNVLYRSNDNGYRIIENLRDFDEIYKDRQKRKRSSNTDVDIENNKKAQKTEVIKEEKIKAINGGLEQFVVSTLEARQSGLSILEIKDWLIAALPDFAKKNIPKLRKSTTNEEDITMEEYLDYLVQKGVLKRSKTGLYYRKYK